MITSFHISSLRHQQFLKGYLVKVFDKSDKISGKLIKVDVLSEQLVFIERQNSTFVQLKCINKLQDNFVSLKDTSDIQECVTTVTKLSLEQNSTIKQLLKDKAALCHTCTGQCNQGFSCVDFDMYEYKISR